ncbi:MAG: nuclear transport factor 2 family protein [Rhodanobacter sp.]
MGVPVSVLTSPDVLVHNKMIVRSFYDSAIRGDVKIFQSYLHTNFSYCAPKYLPWGGVTNTPERYLNFIFPQISKVIDFNRFSYESVTAESDRVVALFKVGVIGRAEVIEISEHWVIENGKACSVWNAYFEPIPLLEEILRNKMPI